MAPMSLATTWGRRNRQIMNLAQSPHVPATGKRPRLRDLRWLPSFCVVGLWQLIRARIEFASFETRGILKRNSNSKAKAIPSQRAPEDRLARIAYVLPRLSDRLPWRSDCLIQAIAAQNWLGRYGLASEIQIGVENPADGSFAAHAWLVCEGSIVTGGDISQYETILSDSRRE